MMKAEMARDQDCMDRDVTVTGDDWFKVASQSRVADIPAVQDKLRHHPHWLDETIIPRRVTIETVFGCNARCRMCVIDHPTDRPRGFMPMDLFRRTIDALAPHRDHIEMFDLFALGEPMLDPHIFERIAYVKAAGFRRLAISSNGHLLTAERQQALLESGLDTLFISIDGTRKETHEAIRQRLDFDRVVEHAEGVIARRNAGNFKTRFIIRFIRQDLNRAEWPAFEDYWRARIDPARGDMIAVYDMHTWAGAIASKDSVIGTGRDDAVEREPCHHIFNAMLILANGAVALCSEDMLRGAYGLGDVAAEDPIAAFNSVRFQAMRKLHLAGEKALLKGCSECTLLYSERVRSTS